MTPAAIEKWHQFLETRDIHLLDELLADDVCFYSPVVHTVQQGKAITKMYLHGAAITLFNDSFHYVRAIYGDGFAMLEFELELNGIQINGVDMISWNADDQIIEFKVMIRPLKGINMVHQVMGEALNRMKQG